MNAVECLERAYQGDRLMSAKLDQYASLQGSLNFVRCAASNGTEQKGLSELMDAVMRDLNGCLDVRKEAMEVIRSMENPEYRLLLELRYLCGKSWDDIAAEMGCSTRQVFRVHRLAVRKLEKMVEMT
jgi:DNA-directed RNA polymerase specialized sigma subunit